MLIKRRGKVMEENRIEFIRSKDNITFRELKGIYLFARRKNKVFIVAYIIILLCSFSILAMNFFQFSFTKIFSAIIFVLFLMLCDSIKALCAYRKIKKKNKCIRFSFEDENIVVDDGMIRSEFKYSILSNITLEENGVFIVIRKKVIYFFPREEIEEIMPVPSFVDFLRQKTGLPVENSRGKRSSAVAVKVVTAVLAVAIIAANFTFFSTPSKVSYGGCTVELNKSYRGYEDDDGDLYTAVSSYEKIEVSIYNYQFDEFSDAYGCGEVGSVYQIVEVFVQDMQEMYGGERLERNGEWLSSLPNGMKTVKMKYIGENGDVYGVFCFKTVGEKVYIIEFLSDNDFTENQNKKIDKYISTIQTA